VQQTALEDGVAKARSLRNYRVVNPREGFHFNASIQCSRSLSDDEQRLLQQAVQNLRFMGSRRNRGLGQVACSLSGPFANTTRDIINTKLGASEKGYAVKLTTLSPVIISRQDGDMSTLQTDDMITGAQLRGALARAFMQQHKLTKENAHENETFYKLFLSGEVQYGNLHYNNAKQVPAFVHKPKYDEKAQPVNVFEAAKGITKPVGGVGTLQMQNGSLTIRKSSAPQKQSNFHNSRQNRTAGRNTGGELFYYEALQEDQTFYGTITGTPEALQLFSNAFGTQLHIRLGRSKSAQYGEALLSIKPLDTQSKTVASNDGSYLLVTESPLVLVNECNFPAVSEAALKEALQHALGLDVTVEQVAGGTTWVESYNAVWQAKSGKYPAYAAGTTFKIKAPNDLPAEIRIGKFTELGYGMCRIMRYEKNIVVEEDKQNQLPATGNATALSNAAPGLLKDIAAFQKQKETYHLLENKAIDDAQKKAGKLNNHQCGRLENVLMAAEAGNQTLKDFLNDVKSKPLGDSLAKANILLSRDKDIQIEIPSIVGIDNPTWNEQRHYWLTFFRSLRKFNQLKKK
jgi:hypothetical protein